MYNTLTAARLERSVPRRPPLVKTTRSSRYLGSWNVQRYVRAFTLLLFTNAANALFAVTGHRVCTAPPLDEPPDAWTIAASRLDDLHTVPAQLLRSPCRSAHDPAVTASVCRDFGRHTIVRHSLFTRVWRPTHSP